MPPPRAGFAVNSPGQVAAGLGKAAPRRKKAGMATIFWALAPDFLLILLGGLLTGLVPRAAWAGIDRLNYVALFPALLFVATSRRALPPDALLVMGLGAAGVLVAGLVLGGLAAPLARGTRLDFAAQWQTAWRFNTALGFVALAALPEAASASMAVVIGISVPVSNALAVLVLARGGGHGAGRALLGVARNPFLLASLAGLTVALLGWRVPALAEASLNRMGMASIPLALLSVGAMLDWRGLLVPTREGVALLGVKLAALPLVALALAWALGMAPMQRAVLVTFAALPTATAGVVLARAFGADTTRTATLIAQSTLIAAVTLPAWMGLVL